MPIGMQALSSAVNARQISSFTRAPAAMAGQDSAQRRAGKSEDRLRGGIGYRRRRARMYSKTSGKSENAMIATITSAKLSCTSGSLPNR